VERKWRIVTIQTPESKKPGARPGFCGHATKCPRDSYPAEMKGSGRRAREVMPAAMRALVRTVALVEVIDMSRTVARISFAAQHICQKDVWTAILPA
jgi:hypothetical protein